MARPRYLHTLLVLCLFQPFAQAQSSHEVHPDHEPLQKVDDLTFADLLEHTIQQAPQFVENDVRVAQAEAYEKAGDSLLAGVPSLQLSAYDDRWLDDVGLGELEYGVQLPLRRPGEWRAARRQGEVYQDYVARWRNALTWQLAGRLRELLAEIEEAEVMLALEEERTASFQRLPDVTQNLFAAGSVARLDVMQVENLVLEQRRRQLDAEAMLVDVERAWSAVTGLQVRPAGAHREMLSDHETVAIDHPALRLLQSEVAVAESGVRQSEISSRGSPQLTIGSRRERGDRFQPWIDSVAVSLSVPIGGASIVSARTSEARRAQADAEVALLSARRSLQQNLHEAEHELFVTRQALPLARRQADLGGERAGMARAAYEAGELTLAQVLTAVQEAALAARELQRLELREQRLITEYNQFVGELP